MNEKELLSALQNADTFEDALASLVDLYLARGDGVDDIVSALELKRYALLEDGADE